MNDLAFIAESFDVIDGYSRTVIELRGDMPTTDRHLEDEGRKFAKLLRRIASGAFLRGMLAELKQSDPELFDA